jgi:hypothetical protein
LRFINTQRDGCLHARGGSSIEIETEAKKRCVIPTWRDAMLSIDFAQTP